MNEQERSEHSLAIFIDFENLALGFKDRRERFDIQRVLKRLVEKGKIVYKKAYADWNRYHVYTEALHEAAIELIEIPRRMQSGKNSADIRLVVDAMDLSYSKEHINTFVVVSGDSDFSPLVSKLKELGKHVIGCGMQESTSELLRDNCDEFIYYEDLGEEFTEVPEMDPRVPDAKKKVFALVYEALLALRRENKEVLWSSMIKDTIKRKKPSFNETYYGYQTFSELLEDAAKEGFLEVEKHKRSGTYVVTRFGEDMRRLPSRRQAEFDDQDAGLDRPRLDRRRRGPERPERRERMARGPRVERSPRPARVERPVVPLEPPVLAGPPEAMVPQEPPLELDDRRERGGERRERGGRGRGGHGRSSPTGRSGQTRGDRPMRTYDVEMELPPPVDLAPPPGGEPLPPPMHEPLPVPMAAMTAAPPPPPPPPSQPQRSFGAGIFDE